nr:hypothetical protein [uncultured Mediterranean phage uvMED]BAR24133.1 hypothetical protein [uncultured Mediterranean phage uvMED]BAR24147.1 hypothetical protein [uncultured Mediterranean phage uvMED]
MVVGSLGVSTGSEPSLKTAGPRNASSGSAHKKSPQLSGLKCFVVDDNLLAVKINRFP